MKVKAVKCEVYSRVVGYYRPVEQFNRGKKEEYRQRVPVEIPDSAPEQQPRPGD